MKRHSAPCSTRPRPRTSPSSARPWGLALAPMHNGEVIPPDVFQRMASEDRARITADIEALQTELEATVRRIPEWEREHRDAVRQLNRDTSAGGGQPPAADVRDRPSPILPRWRLSPGGRARHPRACRRFPRLEPRRGADGPAAPDGRVDDDAAFRRYQVNVVVDNSGREGRADRLRGQSDAPEPGRTHRAHGAVWGAVHRLQPHRAGRAAPGEWRLSGPRRAAASEREFRLGFAEARAARRRDHEPSRSSSF